MLNILWCKNDKAISFLLIYGFYCKSVIFFSAENNAKSNRKIIITVYSVFMEFLCDFAIENVANWKFAD